MSDKWTLGASIVTADRSCRFRVWAPLKKQMLLHLLDPERKIHMAKDEEGYFNASVAGIDAGSRYFFSPDNEGDFPDPASNFQPEGVHGASEVIDHSAFKWTDEAWKGLRFQDLILYEMHVGTFTPDGTFEAVIPRLGELAELGINAIELMPVCQFPGNRNWGYDGVYPYAVQNSYGGVQGFKKLVDACHANGVAVILDSVYNHLGPEGNYFINFGPYFTDKYCTPWGDAINYDGEWSDGVRDYFSNNALYWFDQYHIDGLRLDAIHMVFDNGAIHFWQHLTGQVRALQERLGRTMHLIAESDLNSPRVVNSSAVGGYEFAAQWLDDFHHALYVILDPKGRERYEDFGWMEHLVKAYRDGFVHSGEYVKFRKRKHGFSSSGIPGEKFVVFTSNHDQIGNRPLGERLPVLISFERLKLAAASIILSPYIPMLFMGDEYAEDVPFYYFISHSNQELIDAVRKGRKEEFKDFKTKGESPDPQDENTFKLCTLKWDRRKLGHHLILRSWHKTLISLRKEHAVFSNLSKNDIDIHAIGQGGLVIHRQHKGGTGHALCLFNFSEEEIDYIVPAFSHRWVKILDSRDKVWNKDNKDAPVLPLSIAACQSIKILPLSFSVYKSDYSDDNRLQA
jgi:maltooligosyltrehalose trehalohydrolase